MAVALYSSKENMPLGYSLHLRAEEAVAKFEQDIEDDFNYLQEILAEAKQHFGRRDSNILLPKTPSMKRKRQESDEEQSSDENLSKTTRNTKAPKIHSCASPLTVINEDVVLNCSVATEDVSNDEKKPTSRASSRLKANPQPKRQQPKRSSRKKNEDTETAVKGKESDSSLAGKKPGRNTRNSRKKNAHNVEAFAEEEETDYSSPCDKKPKLSTSRSRGKNSAENVEVSSAEELAVPCQPVSKKRKSRVSNSRDSTAPVVVKEEPCSSFLEERQSRRNSKKELAEKNECRASNCVPETPDQQAIGAVVSPVVLSKCKAVVNVVLRSPGLRVSDVNEILPVTSSSPCLEQLDVAYAEKVDGVDGTLDLNHAEENQPRDELATATSQPEEVVESCSSVASKKMDEVKEDVGDIEILLVDEKGSVSKAPESDQEANMSAVTATNDLQNRDDAMAAVAETKAVRRSLRQSGGWRRKHSRRSSRLLSPGNGHRSVTKSKAARKKSLVKSSVKLKLAQSKLLREPEQCNDSVQSLDLETLDGKTQPQFGDVRVRLFESSNSDSSSATSPATKTGSSSSEEKPESPVKGSVAEEPLVEDDGEVFHDAHELQDECDEPEKDVQVVKIESDSPPKANIAEASPISGSGGSGEEFQTPPHVSEKQEIEDLSEKAKPNHITAGQSVNAFFSFIKRNTPKKVDVEERKKQLRQALKEKQVKEQERQRQLEMQRQREIEERKRRREERQRRVADHRAAQQQALEEKKRQAHDQRTIVEEKAKKLKEKEEEDKRKQRLQRRAELEARRKQEEEARVQKRREQEEEEKRQRELLQKRQEMEEQERQRKIAEAKRAQEHRERELERERELDKQKKLRTIEEKEKRLRDKEEREKKQREERIERERKAFEEKEQKERARIAQLIREKEEHARYEREQRAREDKERQEREKKLREEREVALRAKKRQEDVEKERERTRVLEERSRKEENQLETSNARCDSYEMTPPPVKIRNPASAENYDIADLQSDDSTDDEEAPRKKIPSWAQGAALKAAIFHQEYSNIDVNNIFDKVGAPNLDDIFTHKRKRFYQRTSSAIWDSPPLRQLKKGTLV